MNSQMNNQDLIYTTYIKTTPEKLWHAITTPAFARQYWGECEAISDWKTGAKWALERAHEKTCAIGEVKECTPHKRLVLTWASPDEPDDVSRVSFDIKDMQGCVCLIVTHGQFKAGSKLPRNVSRGWPLVLSSLKTFLETGTPIDIRAHMTPCADVQETAA